MFSMKTILASILLSSCCIWYSFAAPKKRANPPTSQQSKTKKPKHSASKPSDKSIAAQKKRMMEAYKRWLKNRKWQSIRIPLPGQVGTLVFWRLHNHPFLAEYRRKLELLRPGKKPITLVMSLNTGGNTSIGVHWISKKQWGGKDAVLRILDRGGAYYLKLHGAKLYKAVRLNGKMRLGLVLEENCGIGAFGGDTVSICGDWNALILSKKREALKGQLLGQIDAFFKYTPSKRP